MMKKIVAGCFAFGALIAAQSASAADLSVAPIYKAPPPVQVSPAYNWTGFYRRERRGWLGPLLLERQRHRR